MSLIFPFVSLICERLAKINDKINFNKYNHDPKQQVFIVFAVLFLLLLSFTRFNVKIPHISWIIVTFLFLMIVISSLQNFLDFLGIELKPLSYREPLNNITPLLTAFIAFIFFPTEREIKYLIAIMLSVFTIYWNLEKTHEIKLDKGTIVIFLNILCVALILNITNYLLVSGLVPEFIFLIRTIGILIVFLPFMFSIQNSKEAIPLATFSGIIYFIAIMTRMYSMKFIGLNATILLLLLGPVLTYLASYFVLREKITRKEITTSIILLSIISVTFLV